MSYTKQRGGIILVGDLASRPAASVGEYWYFATDDDGGTLYHSDGSAWTAITDGIGGSGVTFGTPAVALGTSAAAGSIDEAIRRDSTIVAFDATVPSTQTFGDSASAGSAAVAARRDHKHAMPATPTSVSGNAGTATALQTGRTIDGQTFDGTADITVIAPGTHAATSKTTPADNDEFPLVDSAASNVLKKLLWSNVKATLKTYFDTLYSAGASGGGSKIYSNKPAGNITRAATSVGAFSTAWQIPSVVVASGQNVKLTMSCDSLASTATADHLFAFFRDSTQIAARIFTSTASSSVQGREFTWIDENPGAGTYTYEIKAAMFTSGTLTVYQTNITTDAAGGSAVFIAEVYTP